MQTPLLTPAALMGFVALTQPAFAEGVLDKAGALHEHGQYGEAFRSYAALARDDDDAAQFKLATLYYLAHDDVREAMWFLITGAHTGGDERKAAA